MMEVLAPRDGKLLTTVAAATAEDVERAVSSAAACFANPEWSGPAGASKRAGVLRAAASLLREPARRTALAELESADCGKPIREAEADMDVCAALCDYYAGLTEPAAEMSGLKTCEDEGFKAALRPEPIGVIGMITPWNFPLMQAMVKVAPAVAAGCTAVLKPSELASLSCLRLGELLAEAGAPPGALNVISGAGAGGAGQALAECSGLAKLSFTGSGPTGKYLLGESAELLRPTSLELGGKGAMIVFDDFGPELSENQLSVLVDWVQCGIFMCSGQVCSATSRLLVQASLADKLLPALAAATKAIRVGDPQGDGVEMGPVVSAGQRDKVLSAIKYAIETDGCGVLAGGAEPPAVGDGLAGGYYLEPTVLTMPAGLAVGGAQPACWREEIFGPVLAVATFETEEEAIALANDTEYGLADAVFSGDAARRARVSSALESGVVWENCNQALMPWTPFGGRDGKQSGFGREFGEAALHEYVHQKTVIAGPDVLSTDPLYSWQFYSSAQ